MSLPMRRLLCYTDDSFFFFFWAADCSAVRTMVIFLFFLFRLLPARICVKNIL
jgi:hypothetical protein